MPGGLGAGASDYGWFEVTPEQARTPANAGRPLAAAWQNTGGRVQAVCPPKNGGYDAKCGVTVAQAGRELSSFTPITSIL